jgi:hypothetical protein
MVVKTLMCGNKSIHLFSGHVRLPHVIMEPMRVSLWVESTKSRDSNVRAIHFV